MIRSKAEYRRRKIAGVKWFAAAVVGLYAYWWVMTNNVIRDFWDPQFVMKAELLKARMKENPGRPLWLVMGTSRTERGLRPGVLADGADDKNAPLIFNFGLGGANMFRQYLCLRRLLEDGIKPRRVGIEVLGAIMSKEVFEIADVPQLLVRARAEEVGDYAAYSNTPSDFYSTWSRSRWDPSYKYGMKLQRQTLALRLIPLPWIRHLEKVPYDKWGWDPSPPAPIAESDYRGGFSIAHNQFHDKFEDFKISRQTDIPLRRVLEMCKAAGLDVFLFRMPEGKDFHAMYTPQADAAIESYLAKIETEYNVPMIDASSWIGKEGFTDGHHLNATGAADVTRRFAGELFKTGQAQPAH